MLVCKETTLGELKNMCLKHQQSGRDCETCSVYKFCMYQLTTSYPSGWKLEEEMLEEQI